MGITPKESGDAVDTVKSRALRADVYVVSDGFGGYQVNEPAAGVPFLPRLPDPPPRQVAEAPMSAATGPGVPGGGDSVGQTAMPAGGVATMERGQPAGSGELPSAPSGPTRPPRRTVGEALHDFLVALPVILLVVLVGGGAVAFVDSRLAPAALDKPRAFERSNNDGDDSTTLPRFSAPPPTFGTATYHTTTEDGLDGRVTLNADGSQVWFEFFPWSTEVADTTILANPGATFVRVEQRGWSLADVNGSAQFAAELAAMRMLTFGQYVPDALRPYVAVDAKRTLVLSGRTVDEYTLLFDVAAMRAAHPGLTNDWEYQVGMVEAGTYATLVLSVDAQGVVWKTVAVNPGADVAWSLEYLGPEPFTVQFPTTYYNAVTGQQVNG